MGLDPTRALLLSGIEQLDVPLQSSQVDLLSGYLAMFDKWNRAYNLSAIRDPLGVVKLHLLDSLAVAPKLVGERFIDVGTGGGLPGIPLAIAFPQKHFTLLDSAGKKTRFLLQVKQELGLTNVAVINCRVESFEPEILYDGVISRAFASLQDMTLACQHLLSADGRFWAMKGHVPAQELQEIQQDYVLEHLHPLSVPGVDAERCLLVLKSVIGNGLRQNRRQAKRD